jgi:hypothetical protein
VLLGRGAWKGMGKRVARRRPHRHHRPHRQLARLDEQDAQLAALGRLSSWELSPVREWLADARRSVAPILLALLLTVSVPCELKLQRRWWESRRLRPVVQGELPVASAGTSLRSSPTE